MPAFEKMWRWLEKEYRGKMTPRHHLSPEGPAISLQVGERQYIDLSDNGTYQWRDEE